MSDLHKPLGGTGTPPKSRNWVVPGLLAAAAIIAVAVAYLLLAGESGQQVVVAVNEEPPRETPAASETPQPTVEGNEKPGIDGVKPLSPLEPIDGTAQTEPSQPDFTPRKPVLEERMAWLPDPDLIEDSEFGPLPKISDGGVRPLDLYSEASGGSSSTRVAIVVGGLGLSQTGTQEAIERLPSSVTLAFSPIGNSLQRWMQAARREGHEVALQLPMEPLGYPTIDPGPHTLTSTASESNNLRNLHWLLGRMTNYPVVMNYLGGGMLGKPEAIRPVLEDLQQRGLAFLDDGSAEASKALEYAEDLRLPHAVGNIIIDQARDPQVMKTQFQALELLARNRGYAIATASAFPETVDEVVKWIKKAEEQGILIVPLSSLVRDYPLQ